VPAPQRFSYMVHASCRMLPISIALHVTHREPHSLSAFEIADRLP
jgi:hypothetical protein